MSRISGVSSVHVDADDYGCVDVHVAVNVKVNVNVNVNVNGPNVALGSAFDETHDYVRSARDRLGIGSASTVQSSAREHFIAEEGPCRRGLSLPSWSRQRSARS